MIFNFVTVALILALIWIGVLTYFFWQMYAHYNNLTAGITNKTLKTVMEMLMKEVTVTHKKVAQLSDRCDKMEKDELMHVQKIGLKRFNPFQDTGGNQSFILSLLDAQDTGVVISGLYARTGTRWYAKRIVNGKGVDHELSDEEKKAIKETKSVSSLTV